MIFRFAQETRKKRSKTEEEGAKKVTLGRDLIRGREGVCDVGVLANQKNRSRSETKVMPGMTART